MKLHIVIATIVSVVGSLLPAAGSAADAPQATETCKVCHNENGVSDEAGVPTLAGVSAFFLENQLAIFKEKARPCAASHFADKKDQVTVEDHCALAADFSEDDTAQLAEYYASLSFKAAQQQFDQMLAEKGGSIHEDKCERCHTDGGSQALDDAGILAGQWKDYLLEQFEFYQKGERWQPEKMQPVMVKLGTDDLKALAEYYAKEGVDRFK